jgi:microsomal dipeptidase-like Zn-dependent dipeptidase
MICLRISMLLGFVLIRSSLSFGQNPQPVWGFADLHTHPALHLGFGSDQNGENGLFWGKPAHDGGLDLATSSLPANLAIDLAPCPSASIGPFNLGFTHNNAAGIDFIKLGTDAQIVSTLDATSPGWTHQAQGAPDFQGPNNAQGWPTGLTVDHQVMHIHSIKRAFDGGLRLMFASVTDDELISKLWNQGFNLGGNPMPTHSPVFDYNSAVTQLTYIENLVNANSAWMQIVTTPSQARAAINSNPPKLAVVLSLEMDSLSVQQIQSLVQQFGVAHVIPVHLADSALGGTAVYLDTFNGLSNFINGAYFNTASNPNVNFSLGSFGPHIEPVTLSTILGVSQGTIVAGDLFLAGSAALGLGAAATAAAIVAAAAIGIQLLPAGALGYTPVIPKAALLQTPGKINTRDLNQGGFYALMQNGLMLDIAHMGETSASTALRLAQQYHYPLMDSHTGIRCDSPNPTTGFPVAPCQTDSGAPPTPGTANGSQVDERSLPTSQLQIIRQLGGVIGLGLVPGGQDPDPVATWINNYSIVLSLMGGKGVAIGTDANGLSPLIQRDTIATNYPVTVASQFNCPAGCLAQLDRYQLGNRTYDFQSDGIATYALLPDFIQAASQTRPIPIRIVYDTQCVKNCVSSYQACLQNWNPGDHTQGTQSPCEGPEAGCIASCRSGGGSNPGPTRTTQIAALFHSAEDTIEMWEAIEKALLITNTSFVNGVIAQPYSQPLTARGGTPPYTWSLQSGSLPPGLIVNRNGTISGTGTSSGLYSFTLAVQDSATPPLTSSSQALEIFMNPGTGCPSGQHCCSTPTSDGVCVSGCIPVSTMCRPLCPTGATCCGSALPTGQCDEACVKRPQVCPVPPRI